MKTPLLALALALTFTPLALAKEPSYPKAKVSYDDFRDLVKEVEAHRAERLIDLKTFLEMSKEPGVIVLDARSADRYARIHVKGAKHLAFTDFTSSNLAAVIPSFETKILIYCNNNFEGNQRDFMSKVAINPVFSTRGGAVQILSTEAKLDAILSVGANRVAAQTPRAEAKPLMMALNVPTYINLYGYGYRNVYELDELVHVRDPRIVFEGTTIRAGQAMSNPRPQPKPNILQKPISLDSLARETKPSSGFNTSLQTAPGSRR